VRFKTLNKGNDKDCYPPKSDAVCFGRDGLTFLKTLAVLKRQTAVLKTLAVLKRRTNVPEDPCCFEETD
jgi:hypothetical protein